MSRKDLILIATQLAIMIDTGVTLSDALDCISAQAEKPKVKRIVEDIRQEVQSGVDFSTALLRHPRAFPKLFVSLISASEKSGMMGKLLQRATSYLRDEHDTIRRVRGALTYPAIMLAFAISTTTFLLAFVLPKFTAIYASKKAALPEPTKILMAASNFICTQWPLLIAAIGTTVFGVAMILRTKRGARVFHYLQLNIPLLGALFRKLYLSRGLRMIGTMAGAGVSLVDCVKTAQELCENSYFKDLWSEVSQQIQAGKQFSDPLFRNPLVPQLSLPNAPQRRAQRQARPGHGTSLRLRRGRAEANHYRHDPLHRAAHDPHHGRNHWLSRPGPYAPHLHDQQSHCAVRFSTFFPPLIDAIQCGGRNAFYSNICLLPWYLKTTQMESENNACLI